MRISYLAGLLALCAGAANASSFSYDHVEGGYGEIDDADSLFVRGSTSLDKNLYFLGGAFILDEKNIDGFYLQGGLGYHLPLSKQADLYFNGQLLYADVEVDTPFGNADDDELGFILRAGLRFMPVDKVELEGVLAASSNDLLIDDGLGIEVYGRYHFNPQLSAALGLHSDTELDGISLGLRYNFK